ncbi:MAG: hypothetical protein M3198_10320, partial [Actinomycetota bacterium]|nr:hypothetical protein [Actinomycetota bacterium]
MTGTAIVMSIGIGGLLGAMGILFGSSTQWSLVPLAVALPALFLQDACRFAFFADGRPQSAAWNDLVWGLVEALGLTIVFFAGWRSAAVFIGVWGFGAIVASLIGLRQLKIVPNLEAARGWFGEHRDIAPRFVVEYLFASGAFNITLIAVGAIAGLAGLGALNGARVLLGPLSVVFMGIASFTISEAAWMRDQADPRVPALVKG